MDETDACGAAGLGYDLSLIHILKAAEDAVLVDTTGLTLEEAVSRLKKLAKERIEA